MKRINLILLLCFVLSMAFAEETNLLYENIKYKIEENQIVIIGVDSKSVSKIVIPNTIDDKKVISINDNAFAECTNLTNIKLPNGLIRIGDRAFNNCRLLKEIEIPNSVISFGVSVFKNCYSLNKIKLPNFFVNIPSETFRNCRRLQKCDIPIGVTTIGDYAFEGCKNLTKMVLPDTIMSVSSTAFSSDILLESSDITVEGHEFSFTSMVQVTSTNVSIKGTNKDGVFCNDRTVMLSPYKISKYLVTQELFEYIMQSNPSFCVDGSDFVTASDEITKYKPVENISWYQAIAFCNKLSLVSGLLPVYQVEGINDWNVISLRDIPTTQNVAWDNVKVDYSSDGYRLPTEAEWEYAIYGKNICSTNYSAKEAAEKYWITNNSYVIGKKMPGFGTHQVGLKQQNSIGLYDAFGNVKQWCFDGFDDINDIFAINPIGKIDSKTRVVRGCSWLDDFTESVVRKKYESFYSSNDIGIRLVRSAVSNNVCSVEIDNGNEIEYKYVRSGRYLSHINNPSRENFAFVGWCYDISDDIFVNFNNPITTDVKIKAKWASLSQAMSAPDMVTVIRKDNSCVINGTDRTGIFVKGHKIELKPYQISKYPVDMASFVAIMGYNPSEFSKNQTNNINLSKYAVDNVNFYQAIAFCNKLSLRVHRQLCYSVEGITDWATLPYGAIPTDRDATWDRVVFNKDADGYRLPTEIEWEFAARGGDISTEEWNMIYAGSDQAPLFFNSDNSSDISLNQLGVSKPNRLKIYNLCGCVNQWCFDTFSKVSDINQKKSIQISDTKYRICRGGDWLCNAEECASSYRNWVEPFHRSKMGLRLARNVK